MSSKLFTEQDQQAIVQSIVEAESMTSGEIRVHIDKKCPGDPVLKAFEIFQKLGMDRTEERNGVLFYIATSHRKLAIIGDAGINETVPEDFWEKIKDQMIIDFKNKGYTEGLTKGIRTAGSHLQNYFPRSENDKDELSNDVTFGE